ncbi:MAG: DUF502 domain-containing protein [Isosphaeraceae bacterium]
MTPKPWKELNRVPDTTTPPPSPPGTGVIHALANAVKSRILSGLILALPIVITFWIFFQLYSTLQRLVLNPIALQVNHLIGNRTSDWLPDWWLRIVAPLVAIVAVLGFLYVLGYFVRSRVALMLDRLMLHLPIVTIVYKAVRNLFHSLDDQRHAAKPQRVVLVPFPYPGMRALAYVTKTLHDADTRETILCVCILTGVVPPAGFTLFVPETDVIDLDWTVNEMLQAVLTGGITVPEVIRFHNSRPTRLIVLDREPKE